MTRFLGALVLLGIAACSPTTTTTAVQSSEAGPAIPDLSSLTRMADLVIVGRVTAPGTTREIPQPPQTPIGPLRAPGPASTSGGGIGIPITTYTIEVERVVRGSAPPGAQLVVTQAG